MTSITKILIAAAATIILSFAAQAETLKPMQGATFKAGSQYASVYFLKDNVTCKLVVTHADEADYAPTRFEAEIADGSAVLELPVTLRNGRGG
jgi:hypothetical protein